MSTNTKVRKSNVDYDAVQELIDEGRHIFPINANSKKPISGWAWKEKKLGPDDDIMQYKRFGIKLEDNEVAVDIDKPDIAMQANLYSQLPMTLSSATSRPGGQHRIYSYDGDPEAIKYKQSWGELIHGLSGRYLVLWHPEQWFDEKAPLPKSLTMTKQTSDEQGLLLTQQPDITAPADDGQRNITLTAYAGLVAKEPGITLEAAKIKIKDKNDEYNPPMPEAELDATIFKALPVWIAKAQLKTESQAIREPKDTEDTEETHNTWFTDTILDTELAKKHFEPIINWERYLGTGRSVLFYGYTGEGKSLFVQDWVRTACVNNEIKAFWIDTEMPEQTIQSRIGDGTGLITYKYCYDASFMDIPPEEYTNQGFSIVVLDTKSGAYHNSYSENDAEHWSELGDWVRNMMMNGICVIVVAHSGKSDVRGARGSSAAGQMFNMVFYIEKHAEDVQGHSPLQIHEDVKYIVHQDKFREYITNPEEAPMGTYRVNTDSGLPVFNRISTSTKLNRKENGGSEDDKERAKTTAILRNKR